MDNASDYGSEDSRFDSWLARSASFASLSAGIYYSVLLGHRFCLYKNIDSPTIGCFVSGITATIQYHASFQLYCMSTVKRTLLYDQFIVSIMPSQEWEETEPPGRGK